LHRWPARPRGGGGGGGRERDIYRGGEETAGEDVTAPESMTHAPMPGPPPHEEEETSGEDVVVLVSL
jgi:hypothetical protein